MGLSRYTLKMPGTVYAGENALEALASMAAGYKRIAVFTDKGLRRLGVTEAPLKQLAGSGATIEIFDDIPAEPPVDAANEVILQVASFKPDLIVAVGGGSVMDVAKLASALDPREHSLRDLLETPAKAKKRIRTIMIPTTAGTGSEATQNAIVLVPEQDLKVGIVSDELMADAVILDAEMTRTLPQPIAAATGIDALAHCIECFTSNKANPFSDLYALEGLRLILANIEQAANEGDMAARQAMLIASFFGGVAIATSGTTAVHALSYPLGGKYHISHGVANAIMLLPVMKFNEPACRDRLALVYDRVNPNGQLREEQDKSMWVTQRLSEILTTVKIPATLEPYGVSKSDLDDLVSAGMKVTRLLVNNPRPVTAEDARSIYLQVI